MSFCSALLSRPISSEWREDVCTVVAIARFGPTEDRREGREIQKGCTTQVRPNAQRAVVRQHSMLIVCIVFSLLNRGHSRNGCGGGSPLLQTSLLCVCVCRWVGAFLTNAMCMSHCRPAWIVARDIYLLLYRPARTKSRIYSARWRRYTSSIPSSA